MANIVMNKPYKCLEEGCNGAFKTRFKLKLHGRQHTGERPFVCHVNGCLKSYTQPSHLRRHKSTVHETVSLNELVCEVKGCGMVLKKQNMTKHLNRVHNSEPFQCLECSSKFKKKRLLHNHLLMHTGETSFKCDSCNICFGSVTQYKKHKSNHKTYTCDCGIIFDRWSKFLEHRKNICTIKRIDHKCIICNRTFTTSTNLKVHSLTHMEESLREVYKCQYLNCTRSYKYKKNLDTHVREFHEKSKTVSKINCTFPGCSQILNSKKNLKQHLFNIHSNSGKPPKKRKTRKDKGTLKKAMAESLAGINLNWEKNFSSNDNGDQLQNESYKVTKMIESEVHRGQKSGEKITKISSPLCNVQESIENRLPKSKHCDINMTEDLSVVIANGTIGNTVSITHEEENQYTLLKRPNHLIFEIKACD